MARRKRSSTILEKAERRASGMNSIGADLNLGNDLTLDAFWDDIHDLREMQQAYNQLLSSVDQAYNEMLIAEKALAVKSERLLKAVAVIYGPDSSEYEMAGGRRRSERRRNNRAATAEESVA